MGNTIMVGRKKAKVMTINGDTFRLKTPALVSDATKEYPGFVMFDSESVKRYGVRVKPLEPNHILMPNKTYFLAERPNLATETVAEEGVKRNKLPFRRVMSGIHVGAKERLEMLMLSRRAVSDVENGPGQTRVRLKLPRSQIMNLVGESHDASEVTEKIIALYRETVAEIRGGRDSNFRGKTSN